MPSANYRYYCLDAAGQLHGTEWIYAASDEDAISHVAAKHPEDRCEIWQGQRLVAQLGFDEKDNIIQQSHGTIADARRVLNETAGLPSRQPRADRSEDAR